MCGECKGVCFWCNACEKDVNLKIRNDWNGAYTLCKCCESESGIICTECQNKGVQYCNWCLEHEDGLLDTEIKRLTIENEVLRLILESKIIEIKNRYNL